MGRGEGGEMIIRLLSMCMNVFFTLTILTDPFQTAGSRVHIVSIIFAATLICPAVVGVLLLLLSWTSWLFEEEEGRPVSADAAMEQREGKSGEFK